MAKELEIPIIALSQLSRQVENRPGGSKRPQLSDLRESGAIEQDADMVMFIYRPEYYQIDVDENGQSTKDRAQIIIAKNRHGAIEDVNLRFVGMFAKFTDIDFNDIQTQYPASYNNVENNADFLSQSNTKTLQSKSNWDIDDDIQSKDIIRRNDIDEAF